MARQHFVPQQVIRRHADESGRLWELLKPQLSISTRPRSPKRILCEENVLDDSLGDLDEEKYKALEEEFAKAYPLLLSNISVPQSADPDLAELLLRWGCYLYVSGTLFDMRVSCLPGCRAVLGKQLRTFVNFQRLLTVRQVYRNLTRKDFAVMIARTTEAEPFLLTDCGAVLFTLVAETNNPENDCTLFVPLHSQAMFVFGHVDALQQVFRMSSVQLSAILFSWARRSAFCASRTYLEQIRTYLTSASDAVNPLWQTWAREPYFNEAALARGEPPPSIWINNGPRR